MGRRGSKRSTKERGSREWKRVKEGKVQSVGVRDANSVNVFILLLV